MNKIITNISNKQQGNVNILTIGIILGTLMLILLMMTLLGLYINKRQTQTAADAATLAAAKTLGERYRQELAMRRDTVLKQFWQEVEEDISEKIGGRELTATEERKIIDDIIDGKITQKELRIILKEKRNPSILLMQQETGYKEFARQFSDQKLGDLLYETAKKYRVDITYSASAFAVKNGAQPQVEGSFPMDKKPKITFAVNKRISLPIFDTYLNEKNRYINVSAAARIVIAGTPSIDISKKKVIQFNNR